MQPTAAPDLALGARRKIARRVLPFVFVLYIIAYLDRANVAFANVPMSADLGFDEAVFGFGAGVFFAGYFLLEIPGALIVERWSARRWLARILVSWGACTVWVGFVRTSGEFYAARFLLGCAEAGFFPGILVYLTHWFREEDRARALSGFTIAAPVALAIGAPVSGLILRMHSFGLPGWRWVFILEGIPAIVFGAVTFFYLTDHPRHARWLQPQEREWIAAALSDEVSQKESAASVRWWQALRERNVWLLTAAHVCANLGGYGFILWLPNTLQNGLRFAPEATSLIGALPFAAAVAAVLVNGRLSDRRRERKRHACAAFLAAAAFLLISAVTALPVVLRVAALVGAGAAAYAWIPPFWALPTAGLARSSAATAVGLINSVGNLGGFAGPFAVGWLLAHGAAADRVTAVLSVAYVGAAVFTLAVRIPRSERVPKTPD